MVSTLWFNSEIKGRKVSPIVMDIAVWGKDIVYTLTYSESKDSEFPVRFLDGKSIAGLSGMCVLRIKPISPTLAILVTEDANFFLKKNGQKKKIDCQFLGTLHNGLLLRLEKNKVGYFERDGEKIRKVATLNVPDFKEVVIHDSMIIFVRSCATLWVAMLKQSKDKTTLKHTQEFRLKKRLFGLLCDSIEKTLSHGNSVFVALKSGRLLRVETCEFGRILKVELSRPSFDFGNVFSLAFGNHMFFLGMDDGTVQVWKFGKKIRVIPWPTYSPVMSLLIHQKKLYVGRAFGTLSYYSLQT